MPRFGNISNNLKGTCEASLQEVLDEAINHFDFSIIWGHRGQQSQNAAFASGNSQLKWPRSKHNSFPSKAFDVIPYPEGYDANNQTFYKMATHILGAASELGVRLQWGGHWNKPKDLAHFELKE